MTEQYDFLNTLIKNAGDIIMRAGAGPLSLSALAILLVLIIGIVLGRDLEERRRLTALIILLTVMVIIVLLPTWNARPRVFAKAFPQTSVGANAKPFTCPNDGYVVSCADLLTPSGSNSCLPQISSDARTCTTGGCNQVSNQEWKAIVVCVSTKPFD